MRLPVRLPTPIVAAMFLAACGSNPQPATPAPEGAPVAAPAPAAAAPHVAPTQPGLASLAGDWELRVTPSQGGALGSMLRLTQRAGAYAGVMQPLQDGERPYFVRGVQVSGQQVIITLETEDGEARIQGVLRGPNQLDGSFNSRRLMGRLTALRR